MKSFRLSTSFALAAFASAALLASPVQAADYPTKQIELVVPYAAGGGTDLLARTLADALKAHLPQPVGVVNKPGGSGAASMRARFAHTKTGCTRKKFAQKES